MIKILLVEDDSQIISFLSEFLKNEDFQVETATGHTQAMDALESNKYDLILLDVSLSDGNGFSICSAVKRLYDIPIIFLTASGDEFSVVTGLELGADDYIPKPFRPRELLSRIKNVLRRTGKTQSTIKIGGLTVDTLKGTVTKDENELFLSPLEYRLLLIFFNNRGMLLTRNKLLEEIWDSSGEYVNDNTLTVYIKRLREKIENDPQEPEIIKTVRGMGYKMEG